MSSQNLILYFLQASRSIRIAWLLEELGLPYESIFFPRIKNKAPEDFKSKSGNSLGKAPVLKDGDVTVVESGAITEYLLEKYDKENKLFGGGDAGKKEKIRGFIHAAEGAFMVHALSITYARWFSPETVKENGDLKKLEEGLSINVGKDLDWLESELKASRGMYLVGESVSAADTMCLFSVQFIFARDLCNGRKIREWPNVKSWVERCEGSEGWKRAVKKTGHEM